ncbi:hypothetical protein ACIP25_07665 [Streptomyces massasporeus]|uniref:hypothetical protein n=1 Tax=Streptomyces massasporeus TaxID=67324 RepID=UPI00381A18D8
MRDNRELSRNLAAEGQKKLREGKYAEAAVKFDEALKKDTANAAALRGLNSINAEEVRPAERRWNRFYNDWVTPGLQVIVGFLIFFAVLLSLSGLLTRGLVRVGSAAWPWELRKWLAPLTWFLLFGTAAMLPVYTMFRPFGPEVLIPFPAFFVLPALLCVALFAVSRAVYVSRKDKWRTRCAWSNWSVFVGCMLGFGSVAALTVLLVHHVSDPPDREGHCLLIAYLLLAVYTVLLAATVNGQNLRLQVVVQAAQGQTDAPATEYLLARIQTLGSESPPRLRMHSSATSSPLSTVQSEDVSALPAGRIIGALSTLFFALRPDLTWRARVSIVDANRAAVTLSRNGHHAASIIFSRRDMNLPAVTVSTDEDAANRDRLRAQLLTGAAAFILVHLSEVHHQLKEGLYAAQNWKIVTLHVIATSGALIDDNDQRIPLLARAVNEDPEYPVARFEYLWALQGTTTANDPAYRQFTNALDHELQQQRLPDGSPLLIRALYRSTAQRINLHAASGYPNNGDDLSVAIRAMEKFYEQCFEINIQNPQWHQFAEQAKPVADILWRQIRALRGYKRLKGSGSTVVPRLAYANACLTCFLQRRGKASLEDAIQQLRYALPNDSDKEEARQDPCLSSLRDRSDFQALVRRNPDSG